MSYRYPHQDDSDEDGFGESLQGRSQTSESRPEGHDLDHGDVEVDVDVDENEDEDAEFHGKMALQLFRQF